MLVIDVGPSMHAVLPEVQKVCCLLAEKKVKTNIFCSSIFFFLPQTSLLILTLLSQCFGYFMMIVPNYLNSVRIAMDFDFTYILCS